MNDEYFRKYIKFCVKIPINNSNHKNTSIEQQTIHIQNIRVLMNIYQIQQIDELNQN